MQVGCRAELPPRGELEDRLGRVVRVVVGRGCGGVHQKLHGHLAARRQGFAECVQAVHRIQRLQLDRAALARDFTQAVVDELVPRAMLAMQQSGRKVLVAAGGVAANSFIRAELEKECRKHSYRLYMPPLKLCGDNGAMIGAQGYYEYLAGARADWALNAYATRDIDDPIV